MIVKPLRRGERRHGFGPELLKAGGDQLAEEIELQPRPGRADIGAHLQRVAGDVRQMMAFIKHQQQMLWLRQDRFALQRRHHQRMVGDHHFRLLNLTTRHEERAFTVVVAVAVQAARFIGAEPRPEAVVNRLIGVIAKAVPLVAVEIGFELRAALLFFFAVRRQLVVKKRQQVALRGAVGRERREVARADVTPAPEGGGKAQFRDDFAQQRQIFTEDLILQRHVGGAHHQRFLLFAGDGDTGDKIRERFADAGRRLDSQMPPFIAAEGFRHFRDHLPLRSAGNEVRYLLLKRLIPGGDLRFLRGG
ncbi:hypothetical protein BN136_3889 [Cronobacter universalis NCTC 9529]|nr:hypothetical protein BN136_3889 [Cronobacter universalis NCTC 9529]